jgi:1-acyl-sn-glycerol-3-phosphate acyltransferase
MVLRWIVLTWVKVALWFRFRRIHFVFHAPIPTDQPAIIAGNHQNGILDTAILAAHVPKGPYTLSRGSLFDNAVADWFLRSLRFLPVYRFRDGFGKMRQNPEMFGQFVEVLGKNEWLLIFPEGSHFRRFTLRPLQKGLARIAFAAQEAWGWREEIPIVPVGLQYESHTAFGSRLLVQFGPPLSSLAYRDLHSRNAKEAERALTAELFEAIKPLILLPPQEEGAYREALLRWEENRGRFQDLMEQFRADQELLSRTGAGSGRGTYPQGEEPAARVGEEIRGEEGLPDGATGDRPERKAPGGGRGIKRRVRKLAGYGLSLPGLLLHLPALLGILAFEAVFVRDWHLAPAARFTVGMFLVPLWYLVALGFCHLQARSLPLDLLLLGLLPSSLWLWSRCWHWAR